MSVDWQIFSLESGNTYTLDLLISRPNADIETQHVSNLVVIQLSDGTEAFVQPETKYIKEVITMLFIDTTSAFRTLIQNYIIAGDKLKIITHDSQIFYGYIIDMKRVWLVGVSPNQYDVTVSFKETIS
uniref:Uncharacterized protein n=1 Tax=viral metagenome TaxID=1070528 RepID=A0A6M3K580_9ZZZZ